MDYTVWQILYLQRICNRYLQRYNRFVAGGRYFNVFSTLWRKEYITIMLITVKQLDEALSHPLLS